MYKINKLQGYTVQNREYSQYFIITIHGVWVSLIAQLVKNLPVKKKKTKKKFMSMYDKTHFNVVK